MPAMPSLWQMTQKANGCRADKTMSATARGRHAQAKLNAKSETSFGSQFAIISGNLQRNQ
jgi:hypothetical protein